MSGRHPQETVREHDAAEFLIHGPKCEYLQLEKGMSAISEGRYGEKSGKRTFTGAKHELIILAPKITRSGDVHGRFGYVGMPKGKPTCCRRLGLVSILHHFQPPKLRRSL
jgi:hypothetical protein